MISIITPVYNVERYLPACIESILQQTYSDFELILVDDGSSDACPAICDHYALADHRVRVIHQENGGVAQARNVGLRMVKGEYVVFIDSDDLVHPVYLEHLVRGLTAHQADICLCWFQKFENDPVIFQPQPYIEKRIMTGKEACGFIDSRQDRISIAPWMKLYKTSLFEGIQYPVGRIHEDEAVTHILLYKAAKIVELDEVLCFYRVTPNSIMTSPFSVRRYDAVRALEERCAFFMEQNEPELAKKAKIALELLKAKTAIRAKNLGFYDQVPKAYRMSAPHALMTVYRYSNYDNFQWFLSLVYPKLVKPFGYFQKMKSILKSCLNKE